MKHRVYVALILLTFAFAGLRIQAAFTIPLTIQEAIYSGGTAGVTRSAEPVTVGIPLPDDPSSGATDASQLTLTGASAGQFRVLGRWPSGRIKWVLVDTLASLAAGGNATGIALSTGGGNFGGPNLATDNGPTITVATGAATFTIRKANFNGFDQVVVGSKTVVAPGTSIGLAVTGPAFPGVTCSGNCTTLYTSANDDDSTCSIEENGPVRAAIKCTGGHNDTSDNEYMKFTVRMHFYKGKTGVKATTTLRNADLGGSGTLASAFKGMAAYEWRITPSLSGTPTYRVGIDRGNENAGTLAAGTGDISLYSAKSDWMEHEHWNAGGFVAPTTDTGWVLNKDGSNADTGTSAASEAVAGYADIRGATDGAGILVGVYQMAAYWPKSLEFNHGGTDTRIGIWPRQNSRTYHHAWPQWSTHDLYFQFHDAALTSPRDEFLRFQHPLVGRAPLPHYNATAVWPYPIVDPAVEDTFFDQTQATANPTNLIAPADITDATPDGGQLYAGNALKIYRNHIWSGGGESNQHEFRISWLQQFLQRGFTGRYLNARHYYRFLTDDGAPHSDGFNWRDQTGAIDPNGRPTATSNNSASGWRVWHDREHNHTYGMGEYYYFLTGDELVKEAYLDGYLDWFADSSTAMAGASNGGEVGGDGTANARQAAVAIIGASRMARFLSAIGSSSLASTVLDNAAKLFTVDVKQTLCTYAEESSQGCESNSDTGYINADPNNEGISKTRGHIWNGGGAQSWCGVTPGGYNSYRLVSIWSGSAWMAQALTELSNGKGSGWSEYWTARDSAYGIIQGAEDEMWFQSGNGRWDQDGWRLGLALDRPGNCGSSSPPVDQQFFQPPHPSGTIPPLAHWMLHIIKYQLTGSQDWTSKLRINIIKNLNYNGTSAADFYGWQLGAAVHAAQAQPSSVLRTQSIASFVDNGGGSYTISWTVPTGAQSYRIKWGTKRIVDWIGFNPSTNTFVGDPNTTMPWFAATNVSTPPAPTAPGTTQSLTISTGRTGLTAANFSVKAYVGGTGGGSTGGGSATNLVLVSGNNQTGTAGTALSAPLTVRVTDSGANAVAGVSVTFTVTAGGGAVSASSVATNSSGLASTTLTLGSAAGTNNVQATSGSLAGSPVTFSAAATASEDQGLSIAPNRWVNVTPTYQGAPNGGQLTPMTCNNMGVYDPSSKRTISFDRWYDPTRSMSIYANALVAYDPGTNTATVLKVSNWFEGAQPLPANTTVPTPIDRHPLGGLGLDRNTGSIYLVNGANQAGRANGYYPDHPNDTWKFSIASRSWSKVGDLIADPSTPHPPSDVGAYSGMVYDPPTGKLAYFVLTGSTGTRTWLLDPATNRWSAVPADSTSANVFISVAGIAYDSRRNLVVAYGGGSNSTSSGAKLWAYSVSQNKWTALADAPIAATAAEFAYDSLHDVFLAVVGQSTLIYNPRTNAWSQLAATLDRGRNLDRQNVTFNPAYDVFVFQGGAWDAPVWSLFRYDDTASPRLPAAPTDVRILR